MKLIFLYVGATDRGHLAEGIATYVKRIRHYIPIEERVIREEKAWKKFDPAARVAAEGRAIDGELQASDDVVLLDERGQTFTSKGFSEYLQKRMNTGSKRLVFVVGGAYGFSEELRAKYRRHVSLSPMTFSHQMIRLLLSEQMYRALTILRGEPYHNE